jgi:hypothetical protein
VTSFETLSSLPTSITATPKKMKRTTPSRIQSYQIHLNKNKLQTKSRKQNPNLRIGSVEIGILIAEASQADESI